MSPYMKLALKWEAIADKLDKAPVEMTANTHRLFANELKAVCANNAEAAFSWNGHIVYGNKESVRAVLEMVTGV